MDNVIWMDLTTLLWGLAIFFFRITDVSLGTIRTISIVHGRTVTAFALGFVEVTLWLVVISSVVTTITQRPMLILFYSLGFATGNVVGIKLERFMAAGNMVVRIISAKRGIEMAAAMREHGFAVTTFCGEGLSGPVTELYIVCRRRQLQHVISLVRQLDPNAFYITERAGSVSKIFRPISQPATGWRAIFKKK
jgi:uncharacterized protein YebE (UPF0316 family)